MFKEKILDWKILTLEFKDPTVFEKTGLSSQPPKHALIVLPGVFSLEASEVSVDRRASDLNFFSGTWSVVLWWEDGLCFLSVWRKQNAISYEIWKQTMLKTESLRMLTINNERITRYYNHIHWQLTLFQTDPIFILGPPLTYIFAIKLYQILCGIFWNKELQGDLWTHTILTKTLYPKSL